MIVKRAFLIVVMLSLVLSSISLVTAENVSYEDGVKTYEDGYNTISVNNWPTVTLEGGVVQDATWTEGQGKFTLRAITDLYDLNVGKGGLYEMEYDNFTTETQILGVVFDDYNDTLADDINANLDPVRDGSMVYFNNVFFDDVDVELKLMQSGVKETFILESPQSEYWDHEWIMIKSQLRTDLAVSVDGVEINISEWSYNTRNVTLTGPEMTWSIPAPLGWDFNMIPERATYTIHRTSTYLYDVWVKMSTEPLQSLNKYPYYIDPVITVVSTGQANILRRSAFMPGDATNPYSLTVGNEVMIGYNVDTESIIQVVSRPDIVYMDVTSMWTTPGWQADFLVYGWSLVDLSPVIERWRLDDSSLVFLLDYTNTLPPTYRTLNHPIWSASIDNKDEAGVGATTIVLVGKNDIEVLDGDCTGGTCLEWIFELDFDDPTTGDLECSMSNWATLGAVINAEYSNYNNLLYFTDRGGQIGYVDTPGNTDGSCSGDVGYSSPPDTDWRGEGGIADGDFDSPHDGDFTGTTSTSSYVYCGGQTSDNAPTGTYLWVVSGSITYVSGMWTGSSSHRRTNGIYVDHDTNKIWVTTRDSVLTVAGYLVIFDATLNYETSYFIAGEQPLGIYGYTITSGIIAGRYGSLVFYDLNSPPETYTAFPTQIYYPMDVGGLPYTQSVQAWCFSDEIEVHTLDTWINLTLSPYTTLYERHESGTTNLIPPPGPFPDLDYYMLGTIGVIPNPTVEGTYEIESKCTDSEGFYDHDIKQVGFYEDPTLNKAPLNPSYYPIGPNGANLIKLGTSEILTWGISSLLESVQGVDRWNDNNATVRVYIDDVLVDQIELDGASQSFDAIIDFDIVGIWRIEAQAYHRDFYSGYTIGDWGTGQSNVEVYNIEVWDDPLISIDDPAPGTVLGYGDTVWINTTDSSPNVGPFVHTYLMYLNNSDTLEVLPYFIGDLDETDDLSPGNWTVEISYSDGYGRAWAGPVAFEIWDTWIYTAITSPLQAEIYPYGTDIDLTSSSGSSYLYKTDSWTWTITNIDTLEETILTGENTVASGLDAGNYSVDLEYDDGYKSALDSVSKFTILEILTDVSIVSPIADEDFDLGDTVQFKSDYETTAPTPVLEWEWTITNLNNESYQFILTGRNVSAQLDQEGVYRADLVFTDGFGIVSKSVLFNVGALRPAQTTSPGAVSTTGGDATPDAPQEIDTGLLIGGLTILSLLLVIAFYGLSLAFKKYKK